MNVQLIRNATMRCTYGSTCFLTDPYFADRGTLPSYRGKIRNPTVDLPMSIQEALAGVQMVILSHIHSDHFDTSAQSTLPKEMTIFCQPVDKSRIQSFGFSQVQDIEKELVWNDIKITRVAAQHGKGDVLSEMGAVSGYIFRCAREPTVYWTGDSVLYDETYKIIETYKPDLIIAHSSGAVWGEKEALIVMDAEQTIQLSKYAAKSKVLAVHMDSLDHGTISRKDLEEARMKAGIAPERLIIPFNGEMITVQ